MRILLFSTVYLPFIGGAELAVKEITDRLKDVEFDLITAKLKRDLPDFEKIGNVNVYRIGAGNKIFDKPLLANLGFLKALNLYKKNKYDLIHGIMASQGSAAAYLFKFIHPKIPFVLTLQEGDLDRNSPFDRFWQRRIVKKADAITAISSYLADFAKKLNKKAPVFVVPNGVDLEKFQISTAIPQPSRELPSQRLEDPRPKVGTSTSNNKLQIKSPDSQSESRIPDSAKRNRDKFQNPNDKTIITVSRLVYKNGVDILIKAAKNLKSTILGFEFTVQIIGDGRERKKLENLVKKLGLENEVKFLGHIPHSEIPNYLAEAALFVRPSRSEGLGSAFLEAMAAEVPVIATPVGGIPDFLKHKETGLFCEKENSDDLAEKIKMLLEDENLRLKLVRNGRKLVEEKYNWNTVAREMRKVYHESR